MKYVFISGICCTLLLLMYPHTPDPGRHFLLQKIEQKKKAAFPCSPLRDKAFSLERIGLLPGTGKHSWKISTSSDSAQIYFDQGMNLYYSFHIIEALASFLKAQSFDPGNGMLYWAEALSYGPNINDYGYAASPGVFPAMEKAEQGMAGLTEQEKGLITAMSKRYSADSSLHQDRLNMAYRDAMAGLYRKYDNNPEVTALYADALMLIHPWDLYEQNGAPKPWTGEIIQVLEKGLKTTPQHPGMNHYYIHAVEASRAPDRALSSANRLETLVPGASHMVHMPSHIYIRTGNYAKGISVNAQALNGYTRWLGLYSDVSANAALYQLHNIHMQATCAIMNGRADFAMLVSSQSRNDIPVDYFASAPPVREYFHYVAATPVFAAVRYGRWDELIAMPEIPDTAAYLRILTTFGKGIAYARTGKLSEAREAAEEIMRIMEKDKNLTIRFGAFNSAYAGAEVALNMLNGIIREESGDYLKAIAYLQKAVEQEEQMIYNEPKDWMLPPLPYLGQVFLKNRNYTEAEKAFRKDLEFNPHNCWSLKGLEMSLQKQGKTNEASKTRKELEKSLAGSGLILNQPVF